MQNDIISQGFGFCKSACGGISDVRLESQIPHCYLLNKKV